MKSKILITLAIILFAVLLVSFIDTKTLDDLLEKMVFNAVSILVGLSIAVIGIFLGSINGMYLSIYKIIKTDNQSVFSEAEIIEIKSGLSEIVDELKDNAVFSLIAFLIVLLLFFFKAINIPYIHWFIEGNFFTKIYFINILILVGNFLIFYAIMDSIQVVFRITKTFELIKE